MLGLIFTDLNPFGLIYYPFMISLDKGTGVCNVTNVVIQF